MILLVAAVIFALAGAVALASAASGEVHRARLAALGGGLLLLSAVVLASSMITTVGTKDVGVVTSFGRPTGRDLPNGIHLKAPWQHVTEMDGAIQPDVYAGRAGVPVRIGDSTTATVDATIRWRIVPSQASVLYQDYRSDDVNRNIRDSLVRTQFNAALNDVLGRYNPLQQVAAQSRSRAPASITSTTPNLDVYSAQVKRSMDEHLRAAARGTASDGSQQVQIVSVTLQFINLASTTQDKINDFLKEVGATRVAEQREKTTAAQAAANRNLATSVSRDPNVLVSRCFDTVEEAVKANYALPAGFSCWQGGSGAVVVPSTK